MFKRNVLLVGVWAVATMGVVLPFMIPATSHADEAAAKTQITTPKITVGDCDVSVHWLADSTTGPTGETAILASDEPAKLQLDAVNNGTQDAEIDYSIQVQGPATFNPESRIGVSTPTYWHNSAKIIVHAGKSESVIFTPAIRPAATTQMANITRQIVTRQSAAPRFLGGTGAGRVILTASKKSIVAAAYILRVDMPPSAAITSPLAIGSTQDVLAFLADKSPAAVPAFTSPNLPTGRVSTPVALTLAGPLPVQPVAFH